MQTIFVGDVKRRKFMEPFKKGNLLWCFSRNRKGKFHLHFQNGSTSENFIDLFIEFAVKFVNRHYVVFSEME